MPEAGTNPGGVPPQLMVVRIIWGAMLTGLLMFAGIVVVMANHGGPRSGDSDLPMVLSIASAALLLPAVGAGWFIRRTVFARGRGVEGGPVAPQAYVSGTIIFLATCEGPAFLSLVASMLGGGLWPWALPAAVAIAILVLNFPTGAPMRSGPFSS